MYSFPISFLYLFPISICRLWVSLAVYIYVVQPYFLSFLQVFFSIIQIYFNLSQSCIFHKHHSVLQFCLSTIQTYFHLSQSCHFFHKYHSQTYLFESALRCFFTIIQTDFYLRLLQFFGAIHLYFSQVLQFFFTTSQTYQCSNKHSRSSLPPPVTPETKPLRNDSWSDIENPQTK